MMTMLLVGLTIAAYCAATMMMKAYQVSVGPGHFQTAFMNISFSGAVFLAFIAARGFHLRHTALTLVLAVVFGTGMWIYSTIKIRAAGCGPMAIISMSYVIGGVTIPTLYGLIVLREPVIIHKLIGILLIFLSFLPLILKSRHQMVFSARFWIFCVLLLLLNGTLMTVSKVAQLRSDPSWSMDYVGLYYFFYFLVSVAAMGKELRHPDPHDLQSTVTLPHLLMAGAAGLCNAGGSVTNYMLSSYLPASVQFPLTQSSMLVVITVASLLLYREKPDRETILSLLITIVSIVLISV